MDKAYVRELYQPNLKNPTLVVGLPGLGNVGVMVARLLTERTQARLFAELYSPVLPDYTRTEENGLCRLLNCRFFASERNGGLLILTGDTQPPAEDIPAYYEICGDILDFVSKIGCKFIITVDGIPVTYAQRAIYVAGTSGEVAEKYALMGAKVYTSGKIIGMSGLLLGLAKVRGLSGVCLLSPILDLISDQEAAFNAYKFLRKVLELGDRDKNLQ
ncbi:MAG TPA: hypothetical protein ENH03_04860 [Candidatus Bathyarchaeota archaeon]|nr:hypothetical protein [Candidatus Bathyarchaeota archaeon]